MKENLKKLVSYYKPYKLLFFFDLLFAIVGAAVSLVMPLIVRYITSEVVYFELNEALRMIVILGFVMIALVAVEFGCNYFMNDLLLLSHDAKVYFLPIQINIVLLTFLQKKYNSTEL